MLIQHIPVDSLSNHSYLLASLEKGVAAVIDPARDVDVYIKEAERLGVRIVYSLDTHLHNDFLSGSRELAAQTGAEVCASASAGLLYPHRPLAEGDTLHLGDVQVGVLQTPGHTPEHISFTVTDLAQGKKLQAVFTGGALMAGGAARVDLLGERLGPYLARWLYRTLLNKFLPLPDNVAVYPTHGGGSFCSTSPPSSDGGSSTTIGQERRTNPLLQASNEDEFVQLVLTDLSSYPAYYRRMGAINRQGPPLLGGPPTLAPLSAQDLHAHMDRGTLLVDLREGQPFGQAHVPASYAIPFQDSFTTWVGWVIPSASPMAYVTAEPAQHEELVRQLVRIGYDNHVGYLEGGIPAWEAAGYPVAKVPSISAKELERQIADQQAALVIDVRQRAEWRASRIPGTTNIELGELQDHLDGLPRGFPLVAVCAAGFRSTTATSILLRDGLPNVSMLTGGTDAWIEAGYSTEQGLE